MDSMLVALCNILVWIIGNYQLSKLNFHYTDALIHSFDPVTVFPSSLSILNSWSIFHKSESFNLSTTYIFPLRTIGWTETKAIVIIINHIFNLLYVLFYFFLFSFPFKVLFIYFLFFFPIYPCIGKDDKAFAMYIDRQRSWFQHNSVHERRVEGGITSGSTIGILLNLERHTLSFLVNEMPQGSVAFRDLYGVFYPAVSLNRGVTLTLHSAIDAPRMDFHW